MVKRGMRFVIGTVAVLILTAGAALAATGAITISVNETPVNFSYNGQNRTPAGGVFDNQGSKVPDAFIYDGTTYVPIRLVGNILGLPVTWNSAQHAVILGKASANAMPFGILGPSSCTYQSLTCTSNVTVTMAGKTYNSAAQYQIASAFVFPPAPLITTAGYNLNNDYSRFNFTIGLDSSTWNGVTTQAPVTVSIIGNGGQPLWTHVFAPGSAPVTGSVSVSQTPVIGIQMSTVSVASPAVDVVNSTLVP